MGSPVTWFEINSSNPARLHEFYSEAFGWKMRGRDGLRHGGHRLCGGDRREHREGRGTEPGHLLHRGGRPAVTPRPSGVARRKDRRAGYRDSDIVTFAQFADPDGNVVGLFQSAS